MFYQKRREKHEIDKIDELFQTKYRLIKDLYPAIWRKLNQGETSGFGKENLRKAVDLTHYTSSERRAPSGSAAESGVIHNATLRFHRFNLFERDFGGDRRVGDVTQFRF